MEKINNSEVIAAINEKALADEAFVREMVAAKNTEEAQAVLRKNGFTLSDEDLTALAEVGKEPLDEMLKNGELSEDELDSVAGGGKLRGTLRLVASLVAAAACGAIVGATGGAATPGAYIVAGVLGTWTLAGYAKKGW